MARIGTPTAGQWCVGLRPGSFGAGWRRKSTADLAAPMAAAGAAAATEPTGAACSANHPATSNRRSRGSSARRRHPEYPANGRIRSSVPAPAGSSNRPSKPPTDHMVRKTELMRRPGPATPVNGQVRQPSGIADLLVDIPETIAARPSRHIRDVAEGSHIPTARRTPHHRSAAGVPAGSGGNTAGTLGENPEVRPRGIAPEGAAPD